jgi:Ulp1 protease family, C-terminal catalytic domain
MTTHKQDDDDDVLLIDYKDVCIYGRDYKLLLSERAWLNDTCLQYQLVRLSDHYAELVGAGLHSNSNGSTSKSSNRNIHDNVVLLDPAVVSFFMHQCESDDELLEDFLPGYDGFRNTDRIFVPINDSLTSTQQVVGQGTHWSLLVLHLNRNHSVATKVDDAREHDTSKEQSPEVVEIYGLHYDSVSSSRNRMVAKAVAQKFAYTLRLLQEQDSTTTTSKDATSKSDKNSVPLLAANVMECHVPQQANGWDCGLHVLATVEVLLGLFSQGNCAVNDPPDSTTTAATAATTTNVSNEEMINGNVGTGTAATSASGGSAPVLEARAQLDERRLGQLFKLRPRYALELRRRIADDIQHQCRQVAAAKDN